jgi:hypothetical protein
VTWIDRGKAERVAKPAIDILRERGIGVAEFDGVYLVANSILFWPQSQYWRAKTGDKSGYGTSTLLNAILPNLSGSG